MWGIGNAFNQSSGLFKILPWHFRDINVGK